MILSPSFCLYQAAPRPLLAPAKRQGDGKAVQVQYLKAAAKSPAISPPLRGPGSKSSGWQPEDAGRGSSLGSLSLR